MNNTILYPPITPYNKSYLKVSEIHTLYYEQSGNLEGIPILFLHGGPGAGCITRDRRYFDPLKYRIILFDQRGCGKSTPLGELKENNMNTLINDIEKLRIHLNIKKWVIFGGSFGSTLALVYAETFISSVLGLILHGISLGVKEELDWFYQNGANKFFPELYEEFIKPIPIIKREFVLKAYCDRLLNAKEENDSTLELSQCWTRWEMSTFNFIFDSSSLQHTLKPSFSTIFSKFEMHYFSNLNFLLPNQILNQSFIINDSNIPIFIIHGRYDMVCPLSSAWKLNKHLKSSELIIIEEAGHNPKHPEILKALVKACDKMIEKLSSH